MAMQVLAPGVPLYFFNMSNDFVPIRNKRKEKITPMAKSPVVDTSLAVNHFYHKNEKVKYTLLMNPVVREDEKGHFMYAKEIYARDAVMHDEDTVLDALLSDPNPKVVEQTQAIIEKLKKRVAK
jgi:predicted naringenin-chalcone synthase